MRDLWNIEKIDILFKGFIFIFKILEIFKNCII